MMVLNDGDQVICADFGSASWDPMDPGTYRPGAAYAQVPTCPPRDDNGVKVQGVQESFVVANQAACDKYAEIIRSSRADPQTRNMVHDRVGRFLLHHGAKLAAKKKRHDHGLSDDDDDDYDD